jgi:dCMP deaminase
MNKPSWDEYFMSIANLAATRSPCLKYQVGCVIVRDKRVLSTGFNGMAPGLKHCNEQGYCYPRHEVCGGSNPPSRAIHAEANAIAWAASTGVALKGAIVYCTHYPCLHCLKLIVATGIKEVIYGIEISDVRSVVEQEFVESGLIKLRRI